VTARRACPVRGTNKAALARAARGIRGTPTTPYPDIAMAADTFDACLAATLKEEGGYGDDPHDPGGATNFGITLRTLENWRGRAATAADVRAMTRAEAAAIYRARFWNGVNADTLAAGVDLAAFDYGVNSGPARARDALAHFRLASGLEVIRGLSRERLAFLHGLMTFRYFGAGWSGRVARIEAAAIRLWAGAANTVPEPHIQRRAREERETARQTNQVGHVAARPCRQRPRRARHPRLRRRRDPDRRRNRLCPRRAPRPGGGRARRRDQTRVLTPPPPSRAALGGARKLAASAAFLIRGYP
jgi:lysozyme family protein